MFPWFQMPVWPTLMAEQASVPGAYGSEWCAELAWLAPNSYHKASAEIGLANQPRGCGFTPKKASAQVIVL